VSEEELAERLATLYQSSQIGMMSVSCKVLYDGSPLAGARVTFVPEKFLGPAFKSASGETDARGQVQLRAEGEETPGMVHLGYYRVQVSKKNAAGQETLPARYNTQTILGQEVSPDPRGGAITI